jgi:copper chaperone
MSCGGCVNSVNKALARLPLEHSEVTIGSARVTWDESKVKREQIVEAIEDAGFEVVAA